MTVKISKPAVNLREELNELKKPTGAAGEAMLRAETPQEQQALIGVGRRNLLINGSFDVWQRGTSSSGALTNACSSTDRWSFNTRSCSTRNISQEDFAAGQTEVEGNPTYFMRSEFSSNSGGTGPFIMQRIEDVTKTSGQFITASFYAKSSLGGETIQFRYSQQFGSGGSSSTERDVEAFTLSSSWKKYVITYQLASVSGKTIGTGNYLRLDFELPANTAITFDISQVQLEVGKVATPFEHRSFGEELALCKRYFEKSTDYHVHPTNSTNATSFAGGLGANSLLPVAIWSRQEKILFEVEKRAAPTITGYGNQGGQWGYLTAGTSGPSGVNTFTFSVNIYKASTTKCLTINNQVSTSPLWGVTGYWTADAEL